MHAMALAILASLCTDLPTTPATVLCLERTGEQYSHVALFGPDHSVSRCALVNPPDRIYGNYYADQCDLTFAIGDQVAPGMYRIGFEMRGAAIGPYSTLDFSNEAGATKRLQNARGDVFFFDLR